MSNADAQRPFKITRRGFFAITGLGAAAIAPGSLFTRSSALAQSATGPSTFLDPSVVHEITVTFEQASYDTMIQNFMDTGKKDWIEATITIDGSEYKKVGMRLKGNSSLSALRSPGGGQGGQFDGPGPVSDTGTPVAGGVDLTQGAEGMFSGVTSDQPEGLPWLVRLDKHDKEQNHHGMTELVIRSNGTVTSLNEAVALDLLTTAGLASELAAATSFSVNSSEAKLRLAIEHPNDDWMTEHFSSNGLLFKSEATGDWSYRGDDADSYVDVFDLEAGGTDDDSANMKPLIEFLDFVNNSTDDEFAANLPSRLDTTGFATYLAMMDLIDNFDDIDGPGNNSYLYYAPDTQQFTVVPWDMNLAFGGFGGGRIMNGQLPDGVQVPIGRQPGNADGGFTRDGTPVAGPVFRTDGGPDGGNGPQMGGGISNPLVERFKAVPDFATILASESTRLQSDLYDSGVATAILANRVAILEEGALTLVDRATITTESEAISALFAPA